MTQGTLLRMDGKTTTQFLVAALNATYLGAPAEPIQIDITLELADNKFAVENNRLCLSTQEALSLASRLLTAINSTMGRNTRTPYAWELIAALRAGGLDPKPYSGRGTNGAFCVSVKNDTEFNVGRAIPDWMRLSPPLTDALGKSQVIYWPKVEWPKEEEQG